MAKIKGVGAPTRKTRGGIGDIYIDKATRKQYKCTGSYGSAAHEAEYYWKALKQEVQTQADNVVTNPVQPQVTNEDDVNASPENNVVDPEPEATTSGNDGEPEPGAETTPTNSTNNRRTNYAAAYNNNK